MRQRGTHTHIHTQPQNLFNTHFLHTLHSTQRFISVSHSLFLSLSLSLERGLRVFDSSAGGLGGCPYAPGAAGNVATESVIAFLEAKGYSTGIDQEALKVAAQFARGLRNMNAQETS